MNTTNKLGPAPIDLKQNRPALHIPDKCEHGTPGCHPCQQCDEAPPQPPAPEPEWRALEPGEKMDFGDEHYFCGEWKPMNGVILHDPPNNPEKYRTRRPKPAPESQGHTGMTELEEAREAARMASVLARQKPAPPAPQQTAREWVHERSHEGSAEPFYSWVYESAALELADRADAAEAKLHDATSWWHPAMSALIDQQQAELAQARAELAALKAEPQPVPLDRPDKPGWWWVWSKIGNRWEIEWVEHPTAFYRGKWLPATLPPAPSEEGVR